ncbi:extracellular solute-binding protein [Paucibacter sp. JuS9]|uniref:extracellular solute-binding protein n=1 Tax=Paucibacter sp. JuS9 TaxID=3228748 RepID=UPI0037583F59
MNLSRRHHLSALLGLMAARPALAGNARLAKLASAARAEGQLVSTGMPDSWANWRETWHDLLHEYGLSHVDHNLSSAEQLTRLASEGRAASIDLCDVGFEFAAQAKAAGLTRAHKPLHWEQIPDWAKDADGHWALAYTGTIAFAVNTRRVPQLPRSWRALLASSARVLIGDVGPTAQANAAVLAAAIALGGSETRLEPALQGFAELAKHGRLISDNPTLPRMKVDHADVYVMWDFNALSLRHRLGNAGDFEILIPEDGSVVSGYSPLINKHAPHPNAAVLAREFIFSDEGQLNLARGNARPIRIDHLKLPERVRRRLVDSAQYRNARALQPVLWARESKKLTSSWQREVLRRPG